MRETTEQETKTQPTTSTLKNDDIEKIMSTIGPYKKMSVEECQALSQQKLKGRKVSDIIMEEREAGW